jgi:hypothetical protein
MAKTIHVQANEAGDILVLVQRDQPDAYFLHFSLEEAARCARLIQEWVDEVRFSRMCQEPANPDDFVVASPVRRRSKRRASVSRTDTPPE